MQMPTQQLRGTRVLVTGATGFIGGALAERLARDEGASVLGSGRSLGKAEHLREHGVELRAADLQDAPAMAALCDGVEVVFHVAGWLGTRRDGLAEALNVHATEALVRAAAERGVRRFVLLSSVAAYGVPAGVMTEETPLQPVQPYEYGATKARGDLRARELGVELGIEVVVIRPGMVHGPGADNWTADMAKLVKSGTPVLFGDRGHAYTVYIDNLIDLVLLAAVGGQAGAAYNAVDAVMPWRRFFGFYADLVGRPLRRIPWGLARVLAVVAGALPLGIPLTSQRLAFYEAEPTWPMDAARGLGWEPRVDLEEGFRRGGVWWAQRASEQQRKPSPSP